MLPSPSVELVEQYGGSSGPRYASYPTANLWREMDERVVRRVAHIANRTGGALSLYVHVPFCEEMCRFCGYSVIATRNRARGDSYLDLLEQEIEQWAARLPDRRLVSRLQLGGGTPTFLDVKQLKRLHEMLSAHFVFVDGVEKAIEADPAVTTPEQLALLGSLGFRRLSLGVHDLDAKVQEAIGRRQSSQVTRGVVLAARAAGFTSVNFDLIYGLPFQTPTTMRASLQRLLKMRPDRLSLFEYAHAPSVKPKQRLIPAEHLPGPSDRVRLFVAAVRFLETHGYEQIGLDHFARKDDPLSVARTRGTLTRGFEGYAPRAAADVLAVGPSGISNLGGAFLQNTHRYSLWKKAVEEGVSAVVRGHVRTDDDELRGEAIRTLMCLFKLEKDRLVEHHGPAAEVLWTEVCELLKPLVADDLARIARRTVNVTPLGRVFLRAIAMRFDATLDIVDAGLRRASRPAVSAIS